LLACDWTLADGTLKLVATVPAGTTAEIVIPAEQAQAVLEGGLPAAAAPGVKSAIFKDRALTVSVGSGRYEFTAPHRP
jgi:alpha-L-rhamnosidase